MQRNNLLIVAGFLSFFAALLHISCIFGAGEGMAQMAAAGDSYPTIVTLIIATILAGWGFYALSGAGVIFKLPLLKTCLVLITAVYLVRGVAGLIVPFFTSAPVVHQNSPTFGVVSSVICCIFGAYYLLGTIRLWR
ncbi:hypothetical protein [Shewanella sp. UCD-KL21]|uniref:hypothetical protein n=1 Tax=Shewanella sp. UCD-KL21 TaxID=1917164 RepID=UPI000970C5AE|nr:hypothetical protein [Shewanella sp. UCD-KL21]